MLVRRGWVPQPLRVFGFVSDLLSSREVGIFQFHGGFTEVFTVVGGPWVPKIQYTLSP